MRVRTAVAVTLLAITASSWGVASASTVPTRAPLPTNVPVALPAPAPGGIPEIDNADAKLSVNGNLASTTCSGEDGIPYLTWRGSWSGPEGEVMPGSTDYNLSGKVNITGIDWTINQRTLRGLLTGTIQLKDSTGVLQYKGTLTLVTQLAAGTTVTFARGFISAKTYIGGTPDGGSLIANVEMKIPAPTSALGLFGDLPGGFGYPDYSVTTINQSC